MLKTDYQIFPLGDAALTIDFGTRIDAAINARVMQLADYCLQQPFAGLKEVVPAYASLTVFYDVAQVRSTYTEAASAGALVEKYLSAAVGQLSGAAMQTTNVVEIPVIYDGEDLPFVAEYHGLSIKEVIRLHTAGVYRVYMMGFLPGFAYLGGMDARIAAPRRATPRTKVPAGSVGIAGQQTGIYPLESPGGWQLIGRTPLALFRHDAPTPALLKAGDTVRFVSLGTA